MLCITLETGLEAGLVNPLAVSLNISAEQGTEFMSIASVVYSYAACSVGIDV